MELFSSSLFCDALQNDASRKAIYFNQTINKIEKTSIKYRKNIHHLFLASQLPSLGCYLYWKSSEFKK